MSRAGLLVVMTAPSGTGKSSVVRELVGRTAEEVAALRRGGSEAEAVLTDDVVDQFSLSGTLEDCLRKIQQMGELGITHLTLIPAAKDPRSLIETFGREVLPRFT